MTWLEITWVPKASRVEALSDALTSAGALAVTLASAAEDPLYEPAPGEMPLWRATAVTGLFPGHFNIHELLRGVADTYPHRLPMHRVQRLRDQDWERAWLTRFAPRRFGRRLWVRPAQLPLPDDADHAVEVILDPGLAFGTGTHPSTALCLEWLDAQDLDSGRLLDYGCGSGILAIAGVKLGATGAIAVDIDPQALTATRKNASDNQLEKSISIGPPELARGERFEWLVANILANPLTMLADEICGCLNRGGGICLAGILEPQANQVMAAYSDRIRFRPVFAKHGWVRLTGTRK